MIQEGTGNCRVARKGIHGRNNAKKLGRTGEGNYEINWEGIGMIL